MSSVFKILIVDDEKDYRDTLNMLLTAKGYIVGEAASAKEALDIIEREYYPVVVSDVMMPGMNGMDFLRKVKEGYDKALEMILVTGYGNVENAVQAMKSGAFGYFIKSHNPEELLIEIEKARKIINLQNQNSIEKRHTEGKRYLLQSKNSKMKEIIEIINTVAKSNANVLIKGESGVGKEVVAQMIHDRSLRAASAFVAINCQSFSDNLLESELFGHEKGAFTGAVERRLGRFEESHGGTLFLDEIGELSLSTQVKLLRVVENRTIERIGSNKPIFVDFRLISATNRDIRNLVKIGKFREDLLYRINTIEVEIPPLRERKEDIEDMIFFFADMFKNELKKDITGIDDETMSFLMEYDYPGNIRELKNMIERLVVMSEGGMLKNRSGIAKTKKTDFQGFDVKPYKEAKSEFEIEYLANVLKQCNNNITRAAEMMRISRRQLFNKITEYNLKDIL